MVSRAVTQMAAIAAIAAVGYVVLGLPLLILIPGALVLAIVAILGDAAARREDTSSTGFAGSTASLVQASGLLLAVLGLAYYVDDPVAWALDVWWMVPAGAVLLFGYWYAQHRRQVATAQTAVSRTRRTASRTISDWTSFILGIGILILTAGFAVLQGFGDALAPYGGELAYFVTVAIGYAGLGGEASWASYIPDLSPIVWVGVALAIGGIGLYIESQA